MVIVETFGGAPADLVQGMGSLAEELDVRVQVNYQLGTGLTTNCRVRMWLFSRVHQEASVYLLVYVFVASLHKTIKHLHEHKVVRLVVKEDMHSEFVEKFLVKKPCDYIRTGVKDQFLDFLHTCSVCTEHQTMLKTRV